VSWDRRRKALSNFALGKAHGVHTAIRKIWQLLWKKKIVSMSHMGIFDAPGLSSSYRPSSEN
jgi:hypothetical protein